MESLKKTYYRFIYPNKRLHYRLLPTAIFLRFLIEHVVQMPRQLLTVDLIRFAVCLPRYLFLSVLMRRTKIASSSDGVSDNTVKHNIRGMGELAAPRSHILVRPLLSINDVKRNVASMKVLSIGPRTEGEIFNLVGYGFRRRNIVGLDLISYSPYIRVGNMHAMPFESASFDLVICGWVLGYSDDKKAAAAEILRVTKKGGIVAVGVAFTKRSREDLEHRTGGLPGSEEQIQDLSTMEACFQSGIAEKHFREDGSTSDIEGSSIISIFRVK